MQEKTVQRQPGTGRQEPPYTTMPAYGENRPVQKKRKEFTWNKLLALAAALIILIAPQMAGYSASGFGVSYQASIHAFFQEDDALMLLYVPFLIGALIPPRAVAGGKKDKNFH